MEIIKHLDEGKITAQIAVFLGLKTCATGQINRNAENIREHIMAVISSEGSTIITKHRLFVLEKTEKLLYAWILDMNQRNISISTAVIQEKEKRFFNTIGSEKEVFEFNASRGWFSKFKSRFGLHSLKLTGEAAGADYEETKKFPDMLKSIIDEGGYSPRQVFNVDETGLYWKRLPSRTFISKEEATITGFKVSKDRLTLVLGGNAAGDFKLKPLL